MSLVRTENGFGKRLRLGQQAVLLLLLLLLLCILAVGLSKRRNAISLAQTQGRQCWLFQVFLLLLLSTSIFTVRGCQCCDCFFPFLQNEYNGGDKQTVPQNYHHYGPRFASLVLRSLSLSLTLYLSPFATLSPKIEQIYVCVCCPFHPAFCHGSTLSRCRRGFGLSQMARMSVRTPISSPFSKGGRMSNGCANGTTPRDNYDGC